MSINLKNEYDSRDTLDKKIERLKLYCKEHPYVFSNYAEIRKRLQDEGRKKELEELEELYNSSYAYILNRKSDGKITDKMKEELTEAKIGGAFGLSKEDSILEKKYGINRKFAVRLLQDFGTLDNFREAYIDLRLDLINNKAIYYKDILDKHNEVAKYIKDLPVVETYDMESSPRYSSLMNAITGGEIKSKVLGKGYTEDVDKALELLTDRERKVLTMRFGLNGEQPKTLKEISHCFNLSGERMREIEAKALRKMRYQKKIKNIVFDKVYNASEEFVQSYFQMHDVFVNENEPNLTEEEIGKLMTICEREKQIEIEREGQRKKQEIKNQESEFKNTIKELTKNGDVPIDDLMLSKRAYNCMRRAGIRTVSELLEKIQTEEDFKKFRFLGKKTKKEIIDEIHDAGFNFRFEVVEEVREEDNIDVGKQKQSTGEEKKIQEKNEPFERDEKEQQVSEKGFNESSERDEKEQQVSEKGTDESSERDEKEQQVPEKGFDESSERDEKEQQLPVQKQIQKEQPKSDLKNEYQKLIPQIVECDAEYSKIKKNYEKINLKRETIKAKIEDLINQIDETSNNNVTQDTAVTLMDAFKLLQEQRALLKDIEVKLSKMNEIENVNREKRNKLTKKLREIIRERE